MSPVAQSDRHDGPGLLDESIPGKAAVVENVLVGPEDAVGEPVVAHELPDVLHRVQFRGLRWQRQQGDVVGDRQLGRRVPTCLVEQHNGMRAGRHGAGDLLQMQRHRLARAAGQHQSRPLALGRADRAEQIGRARALIVRRRRPGATARPAAGDLVLLADAGLVLPPDLYGLAGSLLRCDLRQQGGEVFLNASAASGSLA